MSYYIYDLVYLLSVTWDLMHIPYMQAAGMLYSSPQIIFDGLMKHMNLLVSGLWTVILLFFIYKQGKLTLKYLVNRLALIPFSVVLIAGIIHLIYIFGESL